MIEELLKIETIVQILLFAVVFYYVLNFVRGTPAAAMLKGVAFLIVVGIIGLMYIADRWDLQYIKGMVQWVLSGLFVGLIIIFAPEMRRGLTRLSQSKFLSPLFQQESTKIVDEIVNAAKRLSKNRIGMLVAIEREVGLSEYVEQGIPINGNVTHELLETIFYPGSALHDGAVIIQTDQVAAAGCLFPLTDDPAISKSTGTRHRAAIGISEQTDAVTVIVSEETGRISITVGGKIRTDLTPEQLEQALRELLMRAERPDEPPYQMKPPTDGDGPMDGNGDPTPPTIGPDRPSEKGKSSTKRDKKKS